MNDLWTPSMDARLAELVAAGHSTREIAAVMGRTRNAVIGRSHRIGVNLKGGPPLVTTAKMLAQRRDRENALNREARAKRIACVAAHSEPVSRASRAAPPIFRERAFLALPDAPEAVPFADLRIGHCRWPIACDDGETRYCGLPRGRSYCDEHAAMARRAS